MTKYEQLDVFELQLLAAGYLESAKECVEELVDNGEFLPEADFDNMIGEFNGTLDTATEAVEALVAKLRVDREAAAAAEGAGGEEG